MKKLSLKIACFTSSANEHKYEYFDDEVAALVGDFSAFPENSAAVNVLMSIRNIYICPNLLKSSIWVDSKVLG